MISLHTLRIKENSRSRQMFRQIWSNENIYKSKMEFNEDILMIVENCLLYNADMGSIYRSFAYSLKDRSELLLKEVPDILIKHINTLTEEELRKWKQERSNLFLQRNKMEKINIPPLTFDPLGVIQ